ncbi:MAG: glycoside hydrolase [Flavobacteriales bacterium]|nr:glycoside hydrolase [Flavobacteriales bacterium]
MENPSSKRNMFKNLLLMFIVFLLSSCAAVHLPEPDKIEGVALESPSRPSEADVMKDIRLAGAEYVCLMPYGYMSKDSTRVRYDNAQWQWWGERSEGISTLIQDARSRGLSIMLKPHIWIGWGDYTGDLNFLSDRDQTNWNASYTDYLLHYARLAEQYDVEIFCIGTELCMQLNDDPEYWSGLIEEVKSVYQGKLTYASNWDCYQDFPFWGKLDYIGIDAYFPLLESTEADLHKVSNGWKYWKDEMNVYSTDQNKPILFTEYGYRSVEFGLREPWEMSRSGEVSNDIQELGYQGLFKSIWNEPWFAGGFLWKWHCLEHLEHKDKATRFTPQGKPGLDIIIKNYKGQFLKKEE